MAAVLTRLFPSTNTRTLTRRSLNAKNAEAFLENSTLGMDAMEIEEEQSGRSRTRGGTKGTANVDGDFEQSPENSDERAAIVNEDDEAEEDEEETIKIRRLERSFRTRPPRTRRRRSGRKGITEEEEDEDEQEIDDDDHPSPDSSEVTDPAGPLWEGGESDAVEEEVENLNPNRCIFCGEDEENDPSEDFEEYLACAVCGDNGHRQCAREANSLAMDDDTQDWRCPSCVENGVEQETRERSRRRSSQPKMARDLLPNVRGGIKPGGHSVFNTLILGDDPLDGSRALRKRKPSSEESDAKLRPDARKRRRALSEVDSPRGEIATLADAKLETLEEADTMNLDGAGGSPKSREIRLRGQKKVERSLCRVTESGSDHLVVVFALDPAKLANLDAERRKRKRRERDRARRARQAEPVQIEVEEVPVAHYPAVQASSFNTFYAFNDKETDESKSKPYGGILSEAEADTSRTFPEAADRKKFEDARLKAEDEWKKKMEAASLTDNPRPLQKVSGPPSKIKCINFGKHEIDTWHAAPYPEEYSRNRVLYICEFCLKYMSSDFVAWRHKLKCPSKHPPGDEIYRSGPFSFFEVDGRKNPVYCQNLCLLAKLFLGSKTLYYDVEPFLFYVMTEADDFGSHFVGYFSKEKRPSSLNNVSCILVLPIHQRRGFGSMLIEFSYLLTKVEGKTGSPEKPLSDMGLVSYRTYWRLVLCRELLSQKGRPLSITDLSELTGMTADDIVSALEGLRALVRDPVTKTYALRMDYAFFRQYIDNYEKKGYPKIHPDSLFWVPYVMGRDNMHYENAPHLHTIAQREEVNDEVPEEGVQITADGGQSQPTNEQTGQEDDGSGRVMEVDVPTSQDEAIDPALLLLSQSQSELLAMTTPFPSFEEQLTKRSLHTTQTPQRKLTSASSIISSTTSGPCLNGSTSTSPIPAIRFEIFPPLPGMAQKRKPGRPFGRGRSGRGTPVRRALLGLSNGVDVGSGSPDVTPRKGGGRSGTGNASVRRTRSKLSEVVEDGVEDGREGEGGGERVAEGEMDVLMEDA